MHPRIRRAVVAFALAIATLFGFTTTASADCSGPTIHYTPGPIDRGAPMTVSGTAFGTDCYDSGPPPAGEGVLGEPAADIELVIIQGDHRFVVARGSADDDYEFEVVFPIPAGLQPGEATVSGTVTTHAFGVRVHDPVAQPLLISDAPAPPDLPTDPEVVAFGPSAEPSAAPTSTASALPAPEGASDTVADDSSAGPIAIATLAALAIVGALAVLAVRRGRRRPQST